MNDEAAAHYHSTIDQLTFALRLLNETFGECGMPTVGWQIDPFGHSREFASMLAGMGYDGVFFGRIDYQDKENRMEKKTMEMLWRGDDDLGKPSDIFTGVLYNMYQPPSGFCFDVLCSDAPIVADRGTPEYNVDARPPSGFCFDVLCSDAPIVADRGTPEYNVDARPPSGFCFDVLCSDAPIVADRGTPEYNVDARPPSGFCFDVLCSDAPIVADRGTPEYNVDARVSDFLGIVANMSKAYRSNNILVTMGDDFNYQDATVWFDNLDKLIVYTNMKAGKEGLKVHLFYSTPQCYLKAVKDSNPTLPTKQDDFFPYASEPKNYWTGYYTSRPTTKYFERETNRYLQMAKQMQVLADLEKHNMFVLNELKGAVGIMQHHDAITGTEQQHVAHDYERILNDAIEDALIIPRQAFNKYMQGDANKEPIFSYERCRLNESSCEVSEKSEQFVVTVYNHLAWNRNEPIRVPVVDGTYEVYAPNGDKIKSQLVDIPEAVIKIPTRFSQATHEITDGVIDELKQVDLLVKEAESLSQAADELMMSDDPQVVTRYPDALSIENQHLKIRINPLQQAVVSLKSLANDDDVALKNVKFGYYPTTYSGAYIFRPDNSTPEEIQGDFTQGPKGDVVQELRMTSDENVFSSLRVYEDLGYIENDWVVGPINITKDLGKEIIVRYETSILNNGEFYTDSNGRQMLKRKLGFRPQWNVTLAEPVAGNYYPIVNKISIQNDRQKVSVITDRSEGGSSLEEGSIEVMLHRRLVKDDHKGVGEALNETVLDGVGLVVRGKHRIVTTETKPEDNIIEKKIVIEVDMEPQVFVSDAKTLSLQDWLKLKNCHVWVNALPDGLNLLTLEPWTDNSILIRIENYLELSDKDESTLELDLSKFFTNIQLTSLKETTLAANRWLKDFKQWSWNTQTDFDGIQATKENVQDDGFKIKIKAKQIRTFVAEYNHTLD
ncbi:alpha mannosidase middle domain-containing protein [Phthorimaea operculella]|nr:alpha mannosidase middle domain-containing protein [Phthorimaea operculella]